MTKVIHLELPPPTPVIDTTPGHGECLPCFVRRMVDAVGCTGTLVWAEHWKRARSPRASALIRRLEHRGGSCDCNLVTLLWSPSPVLWERSGVSGPLVEPPVMPACGGVRPRSTRPCVHWAERSGLAT